MRRRRTRRSLAAALLAGLAAGVGVPACSPLQRHAVLDFVFDGVPPYRTPEQRARQAAEATAREAETVSAAERRRSRRRRPDRKLARFVHGPYAADECGRCHDLGAASGFRGPRGGGASGSAAVAELAEAGRLRMPVIELCTHCHTDFGSDDPVNAGLWLHGPVASGWCVACHEPHSSRFARLLRAEPTARLCSQCHLREDLVAFTPEHRPQDPQSGFPPPRPAAEAPVGSSREESGGGPPEVIRVVSDCTRCHDPHRGPDRFILKDRIEEEVEAQPEERRVGRAVTP